MSVLTALQEFAEQYENEFGSDGYDTRDMVDYIVSNTLQADLSAFSQSAGVGWPALRAWYLSRAAYIERQLTEFKEAGIELGAPTEEQRERRGKMR